MNFKSRKFIGVIVGLVLITSVYMTVLFVAPKEALSPAVTIVYLVMVAFLVSAFIGGTVWNNFVKSKYWVSERKGE